MSEIIDWKPQTSSAKVHCKNSSALITETAPKPVHGEA